MADYETKKADIDTAPATTSIEIASLTSEDEQLMAMGYKPEMKHVNSYDPLVILSVANIKPEFHIFVIVRWRVMERREIGNLVDSELSISLGGRTERLKLADYCN